MLRNIKIDSLKGILIFFVVIGHAESDVVHDIIFLFHMPLFFLISGLLFKDESILNSAYIKNCYHKYLFPYFSYSIVILLLFNQEFSLTYICRHLYGGRAVGGVWWFMTCLFFSLLLFAFIKSNFSPGKTKFIILTGGLLAVVESNLVKYLYILKSPGIPWNFDVSLMALVYIGLGYYHKNHIINLMNSDDKNYDIGGVLILIVLAIFCFFNYRDGITRYYFDMKPVYYKKLILAILIPCLFGFVLCRLIYWMHKIRGLDILQLGLTALGRMTMPIMFLHIPLNQCKESLGYGRLIYVLIGIGIPMVFTLIFNRFKIMREMFGLPEFNKIDLMLIR